MERVQNRLYYRWFDVFFQENIKNVNLPLKYVAKKKGFQRKYKWSDEKIHLEISCEIVTKIMKLEFSRSCGNDEDMRNHEQT